MWQDIDSAPKDGSTVHVRRIYDGRTVYEGPAAWRTVTFPALPPHPLDGDVYAPEYTAIGWMRIDTNKRVPEPTHWHRAQSR